MTKAMPFLQKVILLSYDPRLFGVVIFMAAVRNLQCSSKVNSPCAKVYLIRSNKFRKLKRR